MLHAAIEWFHHLVDQLVTLIDSLGYAGIFLLMAIESSILPLPSELVMIPAGYLAKTGEMQLLPALIAGTLGSVVGALVNYTVSAWLGRAVVLRYGKYFLLSEQKFLALERGVKTHGNFATFVGRLIFGVRHFISIPAGLCRMPLGPFITYTAAGSAIWCSILLALGYILGTGQDTMQTAKLVGYWLLGAVAILTAAYVYWWVPRKKNSADPGARLS